MVDYLIWMVGRSVRILDFATFDLFAPKTVSNANNCNQREVGECKSLQLEEITLNGTATILTQNKNSAFLIASFLSDLVVQLA